MTEDRLKWIIEGLDWDRLNEWEEGFVQDCEEKFKKYGFLTRRQEDKIEEIYRFKGK